MADEITEWLLDAVNPARRRMKFHAVLRRIAECPPNDPNIADLLQKLLRQSDDKMLGQVWEEWKGTAHGDLALEVEREMERRKAHSRGRR